MVNALLIGVGGFFGSISRYFFGNWVQKVFSHNWFPGGTLSVNLLGCLAIGLIIGFSEFKFVLNSQFRYFLIVGFLGGFTTFSTFGHDGFQLIRNSNYFGSLLYILLHVILGLLFVWIGHSIARLI